jgi:hypothetical protein
MSETYMGKCAKRKWLWKPTRSENIPEDLKIGEAFAYVQTRRPSGFSHVHASPSGVTVSGDGDRIEFRTAFSESRKECISRFNALKAHVETMYSEADKAVIMTKKSSSQTQILKSGAK